MDAGATCPREQAQPNIPVGLPEGATHWILENPAPILVPDSPRSELRAVSELPEPARVSADTGG
jgi:hypothetical protein